MHLRGEALRSRRAMSQLDWSRCFGALNDTAQYPPQIEGGLATYRYKSRKSARGGISSCNVTGS